MHPSAHHYDVTACVVHADRGHAIISGDKNFRVNNGCHEIRIPKVVKVINKAARGSFSRIRQLASMCTVI